MALYLQYRPHSFADVVGQDHVVTTLEQSMSRGRIAHAYLLCGSRGTGKTSVARILAKTILLQGIDDETIRAQMVKAIEEGSLVDLTEIDAASNRRIDDIRDLIEKINFSPSISKAKVYIIDEVHMLTKEAFNALLKTLEEPPPYAYFILATTELHKVPDTIQSRCQRFLFRRVKDDDIIRRLQYIADQERITVEREALRAIARHASGSFRDGIALLDQLRSLPKIGLSDVSERIGKTSAVFVEDVLSALETKDVARLTELVLTMEEANVPLEDIATDVLDHVRTSMHAAIERKESPAAYIRMMDILLRSLRDMRSSPVPGLALESALILLCGDEKEAPHASAAKIQTPKAVQEHVPAPQKSAPVAAKEPEPAAHPGLVEAETLSTATVLRHWETLLKMVSPPSVRMSLKDASVSGVDGSTVRLSFASAFHRDKVVDTKASRSVEEALLAIFKRPVRIQCLLEKDMTRMPAEPSTDLAEAAAEVFG